MIIIKDDQVDIYKYIEILWRKKNAIDIAQLMIESEIFFSWNSSNIYI